MAKYRYLPLAAVPILVWTLAAARRTQNPADLVVDGYKNYFAKRNPSGGRSFFPLQPDIKLLNTVLKEVIPLRDVDIHEPPTWPVKLYPDYDGALTYIHKVKDGKDIYFFANSRDTAVDTRAVLRGRKALELWDPLSGVRCAAGA